MFLFHFFNAACIVAAASLPPSLTPRNTSMDAVFAGLKPLLSPGATLSSTAPPRWSLYRAPEPAAVVNVGTEADVAVVVKYCAAKNIPFFAQNGGSGWAALNLTNGIVINLTPLHTVTFNANKTQATIGCSVSISQAIAAGNAARAFIQIGNCDYVGVLGATLGGGYGNLIGAHGFGVDQIVSFNLVNAEGELKTVTADCDPDLFWAVRGAGPNFGLVTFAGDQITEVAEAVEALRPNLEPTQNVYLYFINNSFFLHATVEEGKAAFAGLYALNHVFENSGATPYDQWNAGAANFCLREQRKPGHNIGITQVHPEQWKGIWDLYVEFRNKSGAENSVGIVEIYNMSKARRISASTASWAHRDKSKELKSTSYVNFAYGDEGLDAIYGQSLPRLRTLKEKFDPKNRFDQWFPIQQ